MSDNNTNNTTSPFTAQITLTPREKRCLSAFFLMFVLFLPYALFEPISSDTNDDTAMNLIAAGAFGENSQYLVYINVLFGYILKGLFALLPSFNWYLGTQLFLNALSAALIGAVIAYFLDYKAMFLPLIMLHFYMAGEFYQSVQFTRNAYLYALCGIFMLAMACIINSHRKAVSIIGGLMLFIAYLIRMECIFPLLPFLFLILLREFLKDKKRCKLPLITLAVTTLACLAAFAANYKLFSEREEWVEYNYYHFSGTFPILDDDINSGFVFDADKASLALNDLILLKEYQYADFDYFSVDRLKDFQSAKGATQITALFSSFTDAITQNFTFPEVPDYVYINPGLHSVLYTLERVLRWNILPDIVLIIFLITVSIRKKTALKEMIWPLLFLACFLADLLILVYFTGHSPRRATMGPRMAFELLSCFTLLDGLKSDTQKEETVFKPIMLTIPCAVFLFVGSLRVMNYAAVPNNTETSIVLKELKTYSDDYYLLDGMLLWGERLGITDIRTLNRTDYHNFFDNFVLSGGWLAETPHALRMTEKRNITSPMAGLATDPRSHYVILSRRAENILPLMMDYLTRRNDTDIYPRAAYSGNELLIVDFCPELAQ